ncbi:CpaF family protein [soil metagenome]
MTVTPPPLEKTSSGWIPIPGLRTPPPGPAPTAVKLEFHAVKARLHSQIANQLNMMALMQLPEPRRRPELRAMIDKIIAHDNKAPVGECDALAEDLIDDLLGFGPLEKLLRDPSVSDILINGPNEVFVDRHGRLDLTETKFRSEGHLMQVLDRIVSKVGRRIDESSPMVDARLPDGSRVNAVIAPLALKGPVISIRRFGVKQLLIEDLLSFRALTPEMAQFFDAIVKARLNAIISGGTGSGKTTLLNALSRSIPEGERIVTIEDAAELQLQQRHVVPLETRPPNVEDKGQVTTRDLIRNCLRMRPDRIIVGECRSGEAFDMLQAMNTGHDGSLTTLHANTPRDAVARLETMILMAGFDLPIKAMRQQIASAVRILVQANRLQGGVRRVTSISEVVGLEDDVVQLQEIFAYRQLGIRPNGRAYGRFETTGVKPKCLARLEEENIEFPPGFFDKRVLMSDEE